VEIGVLGMSGELLGCCRLGGVLRQWRHGSPLKVVRLSRPTTEHS